MKKIILTASWFAVAVYCILTGVYGPTGLRVTAQANKSAAAMLRNIDSLEKLNIEYSIEWNALRSDASLTSIQGRSLGFIASDEVVVRLALPLNPESPAFIGERVLYTPASSLAEPRIRAVSVLIWLFIVVACLTRKLFSYRKRHSEGSTSWRPQREMRVQEASRT